MIGIYFALLLTVIQFFAVPPTASASSAVSSVDTPPCAAIFTSQPIEPALNISAKRILEKWRTHATRSGDESQPAMFTETFKIVVENLAGIIGRESRVLLLGSNSEMIGEFLRQHSPNRTIDRSDLSEASRAGKYDDVVLIDLLVGASPIVRKIILINAFLALKSEGRITVVDQFSGASERTIREEAFSMGFTTDVLSASSQETSYRAVNLIRP